MRHTFQTAQWVPYPIETVFAFFSNPANLPRLMPAWQRARIEKSKLVAPPPLDGFKGIDLQLGDTTAGAGSTMTILFRPFPLSPIVMKWNASIVEFEWNHHFCDEQPQGPFAYWRHCHRVSEETRSGIEGTEIVDDLAYELPFGIFSEPAHALCIKRQIATTFRYRQRRLLELLS